MKKVVGNLFVIFLLSLQAPICLSGDDFFEGKKTIYLIDKNNNETAVGSILFDQKKRGAYSFELDEKVFSEHFLSMRPFSCLEHPDQLVCHLPYIYDINRVVAKDSLADLEYDLLFLHKTPQEYGINAWNGLYYQMRLEDEHIIGELKEVDLNVLVSPPAEGEMRPVKAKMLHNAQKDKHAYPRVVIR